MSEKPCSRFCSIRLDSPDRYGERLLVEIPVTNIRIHTFAAGTAITTERVDVNLAPVAGIQILIRVAPGVFRPPGFQLRMLGSAGLVTRASSPCSEDG